MVHIGKCAGSSVRMSLRASRRVKNLYVSVDRYHFEKPPYSEAFDYIVVVRNPIARAISAFNYRAYHVIQTGSERDRFEGEYESLARYGTLNRLAEDLYVQGELNEEAVSAWSSIHHLGDESFQYYLDGLLERVRPEQIFGILPVEDLERYVRCALGVKVVKKRVTANKVPDDMKELSLVARANLRRYLDSEFSVLEKLLFLGRIAPKTRSILLSS